MEKAVPNQQCDDCIETIPMGWFLCNGDTGLIWQSECTVKVNLNLEIFLIVASSKKNNNKKKNG